MSDIGRKIYQLRKEKDLTQEDLAQALGVSRATINKYENGIVVNLPRTRIEQLANALHTTPGVLLGWEDSQTSVQTNNGVIGQNNGNITIGSQPLSKEEQELLRIYNKIGVRERMKLLSLAYELEEGES